jgi:hypothetical protein
MVGIYLKKNHPMAETHFFHFFSWPDLLSIFVSLSHGLNIATGCVCDDRLKEKMEGKGCSVREKKRGKKEEEEKKRKERGKRDLRECVNVRRREREKGENKRKGKGRERASGTCVQLWVVVWR